VLAFARESDTDVAGRDVARLSLRGAWTRRWTFGPGLRFGADAALAGSFYAIGDDPASNGSETRLTPTLATELRWPLARP